MGNLIKYEFRKTMALKGIILVITAIFEAMFLIGIGADDEDMIGLSVGLLTLATFFGVLIIGVFGIYTLSKDLNTKRSYMLFMTPHSSYSILGAKLIENATSIFLGGLFFILLAVVDFTTLAAHYGEVDEFFRLLRMFFNINIETSDWIVMGLETLSSWTYVVVVGFFAVIVCASLLNGRKFNGLISFLIFIFMCIIFGKIHHAFLEGIFGDILTYSFEAVMFSIFYYIMLSCIMYVISAWIMDNKLSV